jgi:crotonobetainyl-CoA:carnitine CoA-transferase CaiB-like acyl-CoA transferase
MIVETEHPRLGKVKQFGIAIKLSDTPGSVRSAAPLSGEQTEDVLKSLGMTAEKIADLKKSGVVE